MLLATATVLHRVYTFESSTQATVAWGIGLSAALSAFSWWHCWTDEIVMHSIVFGKFRI
jgi:dihydroceramidase